MRSAVVFCFALLIALCVARTRWFELEHDYHFEKYVAEFSKAYESEEEFHFRKNLFEQKLAHIIAHNRAGHSWKKGVNQFTDHTTEEFKQRLGFDMQMAAAYHASSVPTQKHSFVNTQVPDSIDWREKGIISPVKDQGNCGSCWTFAAAECVESYWAMSTGELNVLSEQQIASCTKNPMDCGGTGGCGGGITQLAYQGIIGVGGLASEWTYPYLSYQGMNYACMFSNKTTPPVATLSGFQTLPSNQLTPLMNAVAQQGPLAVSVDASAWSDYETGVFNGCNQDTPDIDHAVVLVGYGTDSSSGMNYWTIRNSWSPSWGEDGYIRIMRNTENPPCGVDVTPQDGTGCNNGPANVTVCGTCGILYSVTYPEV